mmetsp:Transcript_10389/g.18648  ORF Transcript_10389/g.18648 Transcript_10389/m.18648 type:complete len:201 (+) Transcript_10389:360-962(+)
MRKPSASLSCDSRKDLRHTRKALATFGIIVCKVVINCHSPSLPTGVASILKQNVCISSSRMRRTSKKGRTNASIGNAAMSSWSSTKHAAEATKGCRLPVFPPEALLGCWLTSLALMQMSGSARLLRPMQPKSLSLKRKFSTHTLIGKSLRSPDAERGTSIVQTSPCCTKGTPKASVQASCAPHTTKRQVRSASDQVINMA